MSMGSGRRPPSEFHRPAPVPGKRSPRAEDRGQRTKDRENGYASRLKALPDFDLQFFVAAVADDFHLRRLASRELGWQVGEGESRPRRRQQRTASKSRGGLLTVMHIRFLCPLFSVLCPLLLGFVCLAPARADETRRADASRSPSTLEPVKVPFELLKTKHIAVMVKINGKGPYRMIFDTGAPVTLLNTKIGTESGLIKKGKKPIFNLFNAAGQVKIDKLEVGDLAAEKVAAVVMDHPTVEAISKALGPID